MLMKPDVVDRAYNSVKNRKCKSYLFDASRKSFGSKKLLKNYLIKNI